MASSKTQMRKIKGETTKSPSLVKMEINLGHGSESYKTAKVPNINTNMKLAAFLSGIVSLYPKDAKVSMCSSCSLVSKLI